MGGCRNFSLSHHRRQRLSPSSSQPCEIIQPVFFQFQGLALFNQRIPPPIPSSNHQSAERLPLQQISAVQERHFGLFDVAFRNLQIMWLQGSPPLEFDRSLYPHSDRENTIRVHCGDGTYNCGQWEKAFTNPAQHCCYCEAWGLTSQVLLCGTTETRVSRIR